MFIIINILNLSSESVSRENSSAYLPLINEIINNDIHDFGPRTKNAKHSYDNIYDIIVSKQYLSDPTALSIFELSLSLHSAAPTIQAYYHYYETAVLPRRADNNTFDPNCQVWADWYGKQACSISELMRIIGVEEGSEHNIVPRRYLATIVLATIIGYFINVIRILVLDLELFLLSWIASPTDAPKLLAFDHISRPINQFQPDPIVILYTEELSQQFSLFHNYISNLVKSGVVSYVLRYKPPSNQEKEDLYLSGYGVELVLKDTDYIVIDDRDLGAG
jgi:UDP-glucose:glycoprotein glucosyltransferase